MQNITVKKNQTLLDIAVKYYGDVEGVCWLVEDNNLKGIVDTLITGQDIKIRDAFINKRVVERLKDYEVITGETARGEGIGFWYIENDFIVS